MNRRSAPRILPLLLLALTTACQADGPAAPSDAPLFAPVEANQAGVSGSRVVLTANIGAPKLTQVGDVKVYKSGFGSGMTFVPGRTRQFYLLTDRGPNIDGPTSAIKRFPDPTYTPRIYRAALRGSKMIVQREILLRRPDGTPLTGLPIPAGQCGSTGEIAQDLEGNLVPLDDFGIDPEGIVALPDGTFWISDEYGPFIAHYGPDGRERQRLSPCNGGLPEVYRLRRPNRGMEGLTITPDGQWLVGIMQAPLENPARAGVRGISRLTRVLFRHIVTGETREYAYLIDAGTLQGNSEITAVSDTRFLVIERDGAFLFGSPAAAAKNIYEFDITGATDISELGALGATPIGGKTLEQATVDELLAAGVVPVSKRLRLNLLDVGYPHDKPEGLALAPGGMLFVANDDDFGVAQEGGNLIQKILPPSGEADFTSVWQIRLR